MKANLEEWERVNDEQSHIPGEDKPHPISRTTEPAKLQKAGRDESNTTREHGKQLENQTHHHGNLRELREVLHFGNHWVRHSLLKNVFATAFAQSNLAFFPSDWYCRILTMRSYPGMRKTSRSIRDGFSARRGKEGAIEKQIAEKWHIITVQEDHRDK